MKINSLRMTGVALLCVLSFGAAPASKAAEQIPSSAFASLEAHTSAKLSPEGDRLAYLYPLEDRFHLVVHAFESGENLVIPPGEELDFEWLHWASDRFLVVSMSFSAKRYSTDTKETRLLSVDITNGDVAWLVKPAKRKAVGNLIATEEYPQPQIQDNVVDWLLEDPEHILVSLDEDFNGADEVRKIELGSGDYDIVQRSPVGVQHWLVDHDGEFRFGYGYKNTRFHAILRGADDDWIQLDDAQWYQDDWFPLGFSPDPTIVYAAGYGEYGTREIRKLDIYTGEFVETLYGNPEYDAGGLVRHPITGRAAGFHHTEHRPVIEYFDPDLVKLKLSVDKVLPNTTNQIASMTLDQRKVLIIASNAKEAGTVYIWDRDAKSLQPFGWYMEAIDPRLMSDVAPVEYPAADGTIIPGYLTLPRDVEAENLPAVVLPHGGPSSRTDQTFWFLRQFLASRGYAVLEPNFRGSSGYGKDFERAGRGQWGGVMQDDVDAGAGWLAEQGIADENRICILGWSYGAYSAAIALVNSPQLYQCAVGINGVYNLPRLIAEDKEYIGGSEWVKHIGLDGESARSVSPHHRSDEIERPILLIHAEDDARAPVYHAEDFYDRLERDNPDAQMLLFPHGGHGLRNASARQQALDAIEAFLGEYLGT